MLRACCAQPADDPLPGPMLDVILETHVLGQIVRHTANQGRRREINAIVTPDCDSRRASEPVTIAGKVTLAFLSDG